ncbi:hypothetical protein EJ110_NYTH43957 [Nymphaea thermarum]|nr:hypothetical protein EJ110_NYTH43957 [Nymphaea thermarum]
MAASSSSIVNTDQNDIGAYRTENVPVQVTTIRLTKENYLKWSAAITMGIAGRGRIAYVNESKVEYAANSMAWDTWFLEDNQMHYMAKEWENRIFLFLAGLNDEFENIRSQILNSEESFSIEDVYSRVEAEEQRRLVINGRKGDQMSHNERSTFVSRASMGTAHPLVNVLTVKNSVTLEFCWDLHPEKKNSRGRSFGGKKLVSNASDGKVSISVEQIRELRTYLSQIDVGQADTSNEVKVNQALAVSGQKGLGDRKKIEIGLVSDGLYRLPIRVATTLMSAVLGKEEDGTSIEVHEQEKEEECFVETEKDCNLMFGQVYSSRRVCIDKVIDGLGDKEEDWDWFGV